MLFCFLDISPQSSTSKPNIGPSVEELVRIQQAQLQHHLRQLQIEQKDKDQVKTSTKQTTPNNEMNKNQPTNGQQKTQENQQNMKQTVTQKQGPKPNGHQLAQMQRQINNHMLSQSQEVNQNVNHGHQNQQMAKLLTHPGSKIIQGQQIMTSNNHFMNQQVAQTNMVGFY